MLALAAAVVAGAWWWTAPRRRDRTVAREFVRGLRESNGCSSDYANKDRLPWRSLASGERNTVMELFRQLGREVRPAHELLICEVDMQELVGVGLGLDHDGSRSRALLSEILLPALEARGEPPQFVHWMLNSPRLRVPPGMVPRLFELELRRIEDGRQMEIFHERSHPQQHPTLTRWARELVANSATGEAHDFLPRLLALIRKHRSPAAGTLNTLAPLLGPDEAARVLATALEMGAGFGQYGGWTLGGLVERLGEKQVEALLPAFLRQFEHQRLTNGRDRDATSRFVSLGELLAGLADKLGPTERTQLALSALETFAAEEDADRLTVLSNAVLPLLRPLAREQVAPVLHRWLDQLPSRLTQSSNSILSFITLGEHAPAWLDKADPADVSRAAHGIRDLLVTGGSGRNPYFAEGLGAWAPLLAPDDAFDITESLARAVVKASDAADVAALWPAIEKLSVRLSASDAITVAQLLAPRLNASSAQNVPDPERWLRGRLAACLRTLVQRLDARDRLNFEAKWGGEALLADDTSSSSEGEQAGQRDRAIVREIAHGTELPSPTDAPSVYGQALLGLWVHESDAGKRSTLIREIVRATSAMSAPLSLPAYARPVSVAQLYVDLLKSYQVGEDDWQVLVDALCTSAQRPPRATLWDYWAWTQQDAAGRALAIDWASQPPW
jgi:hypothetical protein